MRLSAPHLLSAAALAAIALSAPLVAQAPGVPGAREAGRVAAGTYQADASHTLVGWRVNHFGFNDYFGVFGDIKGSLTLDPANPSAAKVDMTIPVSGLSTASADLTKHMTSADFFDAASHPEVRFVSTSVEADGMDAKITGNLTIRGVTKPVVLDARFTGAGTNPFNKKETIGFEAETEIKRSDFGMTYGIPAVSDSVKLGISAAFEK